MASEPSPLPDLDGLMDLVARFTKACETDATLQGAALGRLIRHVPGKRAILSGQWQGRDVIFRFFLNADGKAFRNEWDEMIRVWPQMQSPSGRIAQPLHHVPELPLIILEQVPGTPLMQYMWQSDPEDRARWLGPAASWLQKYTDGSYRQVPSKAGLWLKRAEQAAAGQAHAKLIRRENKVLTQLRRLAPALDQPWRLAISHGDFHPNNLLTDGHGLTGIDIGGSNAMPIYKDMARFLMHMGRRGLIPSGQARFGVDARGIDAFADAFSLSDHEQHLVLPFLLGCEALLRVEHAGIKRSRVKRAAAMTDLLSADLAQL